MNDLHESGRRRSVADDEIDEPRGVGVYDQDEEAVRRTGAGMSIGVLIFLIIIVLLIVAALFFLL